MKLDAESYLKSGSNELRMLEYTVCGRSFGINILKVQKIVARTECLTAGINTHPAIVGMFKVNDQVVPLVDLAYFLGYGKTESIENKKIIITEFFNVLNGFIVNTVEWIHHFVWEDVINANDVMKTIDQKYIISIVKPDGKRIVPLLDYESIILDLCPGLGADEMRKISDKKLDGTGCRVLVAEDSPSVRNMLTAELLEAGFSVAAAADGSEACAILEKDNDFDLVISDVEMPQMDGLALTTAIRSNPEIEKLPVIVYSSIGDIGMKTRAEFLKADAHVTKLNVEELVDQVIRLTAGAKIADRSGEDCEIKEPSDSATIDNNDDTADVFNKAEESALTAAAAAGNDTDDCFSSFDYMAASLETEGAIHPQADELCLFESESKAGFDENRLMINIPENGPGIANLKTNGKAGKKKKSRTGKRTGSGKIPKTQSAKKIKKVGPLKSKANAKAR